MTPQEFADVHYGKGYREDIRELQKERPWQKEIGRKADAKKGKK